MTYHLSGGSWSTTSLSVSGGKKALMDTLPGRLHPARPLKIILYLIIDFVPCTRSAAVFNSLHVDVPVVNRREVHGM